MTVAAAANVVTEQALLFGSHRGLVGVVTHPTGVPGPGPRRALVMANVGLSHHAGPFRLYVELARAVAALGWYALRFDLSGLGDSLPRPGARPDGEQAAADVREALDWLEAQLGVREVVLVGLCSGVDSMHPVAVADPRVVGAVFVDGYTYPTLGFRVRRHALRYVQLGRWRRFARRQLAKRGAAPCDGSRSVPTTDAAGPVFQREYPTLAQFRADVAAAAERGARLLFVFTGTCDSAFNSERQLREVLGRAAPTGMVSARVFARADHLFSGAEHRAAFFACVRGWIVELGAARAGVQRAR